ncbi:preprotein translocase subunit SecG [Sphingomonas sp. GCM10030256]|uniref:preprotein translocase subunit SecG n=1 Tax=Sphingomonas sp. GCM10030256 TaxID=3273427 RepID=UPI003619BFA2
MFTFLLIVQTLIGAALCGVILMQRSEGGGLGVGGSSSGFMTARGAADFLTRATAILGGVFVVLCIVLAAIAGTRDNAATVDTSLVNQTAPAPAPISPLEPGGNPLTAPPAGPNTAPPNNAAPGTQPPADNGAVPLAQ